MSPKLKKNIVVFVIIFIYIAILASEMGLEINLGNDYARIVDMDYKAVLVDEPGSQGKIVVTERMTFDIHAASKDNPFWELWRDLCEDTIDGVKVHYKVNSVKQIMPDGKEIVWPESPELYWDDSDYERWNTRLGPGKWYHSPGPYNEYMDRYECVFFYVDAVYRGQMTFEIEYEMYNAALRYGDCSDLYIAMYSGDTTKYLESFNAEILIPESDMPREGNYKVTTYGTNSHTFPVEESKTKNPGYHTFSFNLSEEDLKFKSYNEYIEFDLVSYGTDKHKFTDYASENDYYYDSVLQEIWDEQEDYINEPEMYRQKKLKTLTICTIISVVVFVLGFIKIKRMKKKYQVDDSKYDNETFRDIPSDLDPKFAAALVACKDKKPEDDAGVYSALLLSLARKGYISLRDLPSGNVMITIEDNNEESLEQAMTTYQSIVSYSTFDANETFNVVNDTDAVEPVRTFNWDNEPVYQTETERPIGSREPLTWSEMQYYNLIRRHADKTISMEILQSKITTDYDYTDTFAENVSKAVVNYGIGMKYLQKADYHEPRKKLQKSAKTHTVFGVIALLINLLIFRTEIGIAFGAFIILGLSLLLTGWYIKSQAHKFALLTELGDQEYRKWRGLYNFLKSDTLINERTVVELPLWEKYLIYATAFGISEKVIDAIKIRCPMIDKPNSIVYHNYCRSGRIRISGHRFHSSVRTSRRSASFSRSSSGGGFGYGGGGRGGGGGGGGH